MKPTSVATNKLSWGQKLAYGSGSLTNNLLPAALGVFMYFLVTGFGMDPFLAGLLGGIPRFFDALTDPIMGYITDNSRTGWGRRRPYIFVGAIVTGILFILLWQMSPENGQTFNFWYFLVMSLLYITGNTIFSTPFIGLGYEMSDDYNERTRLMGITNTIGQIAWMIVPWFWALISNPDYIFATQVEGVRKLSIVVAALCILTGIMPAIFCKEPPLPKETKDRPGVTLSGMWNVTKDVFKNLGEVFRNRPFLRLCVATFLVYSRLLHRSATTSSFTICSMVTTRWPTTGSHGSGCPRSSALHRLGLPLCRLLSQPLWLFQSLPGWLPNGVRSRLSSFQRLYLSLVM